MFWGTAFSAWVLSALVFLFDANGYASTHFTGTRPLDFSKVTYDCKNAPVTEKEVRTFVESTLTEAIDALHSLNPALYIQARRGLRIKPVLFSCAPGKIPNSFGEHQPDPHRCTIFFGNSVAKLSIIGPEYKRRNGDEIFFLELKNMIFHEFLHHFGFLNRPLVQHNDFQIDKEDDLIYMCAFAVFPHYLQTNFEQGRARDFCSKHFPHKRQPE